MRDLWVVQLETKDDLPKLYAGGLKLLSMLQTQLDILVSSEEETRQVRGLQLHSRWLHCHEACRASAQVAALKLPNQGKT